MTAERQPLLPHPGMLTPSASADQSQGAHLATCRGDATLGRSQMKRGRSVLE